MQEIFLDLSVFSTKGSDLLNYRSITLEANLLAQDPYILFSVFSDLMETIFFYTFDIDDI